MHGRRVERNSRCRAIARGHDAADREAVRRDPHRSNVSREWVAAAVDLAVTNSDHRHRAVEGGQHAISRMQCFHQHFSRRRGDAGAGAKAGQGRDQRAGAKVRAEDQW